MTEQFLLTDLPEDLRTRLQEVARERSVSSIAASALSTRYGMVYADGHRSGPLYQGGGNVNLRLPLAVTKELRKEATKARVTMRSVVLNAVTGELGLAPSPLEKVRGARAGRPRKHGRPRGR